MKNKTVLYIFSVIADFYPIYPLYSLMFADVGLLDASSISLLFLYWVFFAIIAEVPTGIIADKFSRKLSVILGYVFVSATFIIWLCFPTFWGYLFGFFLWGIGFALTSGAWDAYLYTLLEKTNEEKDFTKYLGRLHSLGLMGSVVAYILAATLIPFGYEVILLVSAATGIVAITLLLMMPGDRVSQNDQKSHIAILQEAFRDIKQSPALFVVVAAAGLVDGFTAMAEEYTPLYLEWNGLDVQVIAIILVFSIGLSAFLSWFAEKLEMISTGHILQTSMLLSFVLFVSGFFGGIIAIVGLFIMLKFMQLLTVVLTAKVQHQVGSDARATIGSLTTFLAEIFAICFIGAYLVINLYLSDATSFFALGVIFIVTATIVYFICKSRNPNFQ